MNECNAVSLTDGSATAAALRGSRNISTHHRKNSADHAIIFFIEMILEYVLPPIWLATNKEKHNDDL